VNRSSKGRVGGTAKMDLLTERTTTAKRNHHT
jgi:hypothetical protein